MNKVRLAYRGVRIASHFADEADEANDANLCANHAYGDVEEFFREDPCVALYRELYVLTDSDGKKVLLAVARVEMQDTDLARCLHELLDENGSGNITELSRERGPYRSVRYDGAVYASKRDGTVVTNAQAKPVQGGGSTELSLPSIVDTVIR